MPVRERKFYIEKHNEASKEENSRMEGGGKSKRTEANINSFAMLGQANAKNYGRGG